VSVTFIVFANYLAEIKSTFWKKNLYTPYNV